jgi:hypothetical protein
MRYMNGTVTRLTGAEIAEYKERGQRCGQATPISEKHCPDEITHRYDLVEAGGRRRIHHPLCGKHTAEAIKSGAEVAT